MTKEAEKRWREIAKYYGLYWYKFGDVRYCIHCHKPLPKSERKPDFVTATVSTYVETKNSNAKGSWAWTELLPEGSRCLQRAFLEENGGWLFIELGTGKAPDNKGAWLVPWLAWVNNIEPELLRRNQRSLQYKTAYNKDSVSTRGNHIGADLLLIEYALTWKPKQGWIIPKGHIWWRALHHHLVKSVEKVEECYL